MDDRNDRNTHSYPDEVEALFSQVVLICHEEGLIGHELLAIDGCKTSSNAAKEHSGTFKELGDKCGKIQRQMRHLIAEQRRLDKYDTLEEDRRKRNEQTIDTLNRAFDKYDRFLKTHSPRMGQGKRSKEIKSNVTDNESAKAGFCSCKTCISYIHVGHDHQQGNHSGL